MDHVDLLVFEFVDPAAPLGGLLREYTSLAEALMNGNRKEAGGTAPAGGLTLTLGLGSSLFDRRPEFETLPLEDLPPDSHVRLASAKSNGGATILRKGYSHRASAEEGERDDDGLPPGSAPGGFLAQALA